MIKVHVNAKQTPDSNIESPVFTEGSHTHIHTHTHTHTHRQRQRQRQRQRDTHRHTHTHTDTFHRIPMLHEMCRAQLLSRIVYFNTTASSP